MSISREVSVACPRCAADNVVSVYDSINAARRPDLRAAILDDSLQRLDCVGCGSPLRVSPSLVYLDVPKNEIQFRSRAGSITTARTSSASSPIP